MAEVILPSAAVHERLGIPRSRPKVAPREHGINIRRLNITDGPFTGVWLDRDAVLRWMQASNEATGGDAVLERMIRELTEVTGG